MKTIPFGQVTMVGGTGSFFARKATLFYPSHHEENPCFLCGAVKDCGGCSAARNNKAKITKTSFFTEIQIILKNVMLL